MITVCEYLKHGKRYVSTRTGLHSAWAGKHPPLRTVLPTPFRERREEPVRVLQGVKLRHRRKGASLRSCSQLATELEKKKNVFLATLVTKPQGHTIEILLGGEMKKKKLVKFLVCGSLE